MGWGRFNPVSRFRQAAKKEAADEIRVAADESAVMQLERRAAGDETAAEADEQAFSGGLLKEDALIRRLGALQREKFTVLKMLSAARATRLRLSIAKKTLLNRLAVGGKRIHNGLTRVVGGAGIAAIGFSSQAVSIKRDLQLWIQEQGREISLLEVGLAQQIKEFQEEAASVAPTVQVIKQQRGVLKEYEGILITGERQLLDIANKRTDEIALARRELQEERDALQRERDALNKQRTGAR